MPCRLSTLCPKLVKQRLLGSLQFLGFVNHRYFVPFRVSVLVDEIAVLAFLICLPPHLILRDVKFVMHYIGLWEYCCTALMEGSHMSMATASMFSRCVRDLVE